MYIENVFFLSVQNRMKTRIDLADEVLEYMKSDIEDQKVGEILIGLLSAFDIFSGVDYKKILDKIEAL